LLARAEVQVYTRVDNLQDTVAEESIVTQPDQPNTSLGGFGKFLLGTYLVLVTAALALLVVAVFPESHADELVPFGPEISPDSEVRLILLAMMVGALGGNVHGLRSFANFVGNRRLMRSWVWWYVVRPFIGLPISVIFYFTIRAGFLSSGASADEINAFGISAVSGLVGMFADHAVRFLRHVFEALFRVPKEELDDALPPASVGQPKNSGGGPSGSPG
jgi:hypothetical protein